MNPEPLWIVFLNACLINNFVLAYFLGSARSWALEPDRDRQPHGRR